MSLIDKLYNGELRPCEHEPSDNPEMRRLAERIDKSIDAKDVDELADAYTELLAFTEAEAFTKGVPHGCADDNRRNKRIKKPLLPREKP